MCKKERYLLSLPHSDAMKAFKACVTDENGWVDSKVYFQTLSKVIKGFNPWFYGGRFNQFFESLDFLEVRVVDKQTKYLRSIKRD